MRTWYVAYPSPDVFGQRAHLLVLQTAAVPDFWLYKGDIAVRKFPYDR